MLTKLLFTGLIILGVYIFYRYRGRVRSQPKQIAEPTQPSRTGRVAVYAFVCALLLISGAVFFYQWREAHQVVTIRVIDSASNNVTIYQAYRKSIKGNRFESLDGKTVVLGEAERVEYIDGN